ncbi:ABC transporter substrate-binding protein [Bordetella genomosp. 11]|uniref:ABC transporter substrate-binding protein n=1 Tax=Bordetella genomosp. 11 TaxID=1416808 RepID=A0A261UDR6_9BORD|nr:sugar ABC transporter substrate-binding protein [Bordetella genomosp. 11]OZI60066.1 ABC transporter substrate-binding protein [Bordetella genomosp. 11]
MHFPIRALAAGISCALALTASPWAAAQAYDVRAHQGARINFLANNNPVANALIKHKAEFEKLTGIELKVDAYQEQQMRQRLVTTMNAHSSEVDVFMSLPSREGLQFARAGWYADLTPYVRNAVAPDYDFQDFSPGLIKDATVDGKLTGIPLNLEGPVLYYRTDIFKKCGVSLPADLKDLPAVANRIKQCEPDITPFVSRGQKPALPFTYSVFLHNMGGEYMRDGKSALCSPAGLAAMGLYAGLLKDYGPPGVVNYNFYQISSLYKAGRAAMAFESSNELSTVLQGGARESDTGVAVLPAGAGGSHPTMIGWTMSISAYSKNKDAAWAFLQWASSPAMQKRLALEGIAPPRVSALQDAQFKDWAGQKPVRQQWVAALDQISRTGTAEVGYPIVANPASREFVGQAVDDVLLGTKPADKACADADTALNALIAKE